MSLPRFTAERSLYVSQVSYVAKSSNVAVNTDIVTTAQACPGNVRGFGASFGAPSTTSVMNPNLLTQAEILATLNADSRCPPGCRFIPIPINPRTMRQILDVGSPPIEVIRYVADFACISPLPPPPLPPPVFTPTPVSEPLITGETVDTLAKVVGVVALAGLGAALIASAPASAPAAAAIGLVGLIGLGIGD
ncbi:hypothetical protein IQ255_14135 [Pleurocapsales cyanobacterium LEGE 10410]|nr:hypothetical protein [Pleurocapsales cyanobacterium LEGE 10410]